MKMDLQTQLDFLRSKGWMVAIHNDYKLHDDFFTFYLFTHPSGRFLKGEGHSDVEAIKHIIHEVEKEINIESINGTYKQFSKAKEKHKKSEIVKTMNLASLIENAITVHPIHIDYKNIYCDIVDEMIIHLTNLQRLIKCRR